MRGWSGIDREIALTRVPMGQATWKGQIRCHVSRTPGPVATQVRFLSPRRFQPSIDAAASRLAEELAAQLPAELLEHLTVEAGLVRTTLHGRDEERHASRAGYCTALWRGEVLGIWGLGRRRPLRLRWSGVAEAADVRPEVPVLLGPSAALSMVAFGLEALGKSGGPAPAPVLTVIDGAASPYPPQDLRQASGSSDQTLIARGGWPTGGSPREGVDPVFFLLTRPEHALRPHGVSIHFERRNLAVDATRKAPWPRRALIVDALKPLVGPRRGAIPFEAELSLRDAGGSRRALSAPARLHCDPWEILARVQAGCGRPLPAVDRDPIEGNAYGSAPFLLLELAAGALLDASPS